MTVYAFPDSPNFTLSINPMCRLWEVHLSESTSTLSLLIISFASLVVVQYPSCRIISTRGTPLSMGWPLGRGLAMNFPFFLLKCQLLGALRRFRCFLTIYTTPFLIDFNRSLS